MQTNNTYKNINKESPDEQEIDFSRIFNFLFRNKFSIGSFSIIFFVVACLYSFFPKKVWEGKFQIVLNADKKSSGLNFSRNNRINNLLSGTSNDLKTEVGILESPSLLMPIYDFVTLRKNISNSKKISFSSWKNSLDIQLKQETSILNIAYQDVDKELILPVLNKIALAYQNYSRKGEKRFRELQKDYLTKQINIFKTKSANSLKNAQEFAIDQDLNFLYLRGFIKAPNTNQFSSMQSGMSDVNNFLMDTFTNETSSSNLEIENIRVNAANQIRKIDLQINQINEIGEDLEKLQFIGTTIPGFSGNSEERNLLNLESLLIEARSKYTDEDNVVKTLNERRNEQIKLLKIKAIGMLKAQKNEAQARMQASMRPKGVILKYKQLIREAQRDETTLINLENDLRVLELQEAKTRDPWELITKPTLLNYSVWPSKKLFGITGLIFGFVLGIVIAFYKEKKSDRIFYKPSLEKKLLFDFIQSISIQDLSINNQKMFFISKFIRIQKGETICLFTLDENLRKVLDNLKDILLEDKIDKKISSVFSLMDLNNFKKDDTKILVCSLPNIKFSQIDELNKALMLLDTKLSGIILLEYPPESSNFKI
ncbi:Wzz/FepE/Etk N-terminal domain-containing protein [Prochlorococcus sp. AH-736-L15]|nr:Wzz/FepE/Etk N-terminal domain-containing protein [Prochlorococcus sp. AH-736-L15]MDA9741379.1 Wzz/FepE/Etk N-terminal domain-containing protein [Prochlorococcus sp. AH-736-L15]